MGDALPAVTSTRTGSRSSLPASRPIAPSSVAENSTVCRVCRRTRGNALDIFDEAHVEHPIRFIKHQHLQLRKIDATALDMVDKPARRRHQNIDSARQRSVLHRVRRSAIDAHRLDTKVRAVAHRLLGDLLREFARRRQHQNARTVSVNALQRRPCRRRQRKRAAPAAQTPPSCRFRSAPSRRRRDRRSAEGSSAPG